MPTLKKTDSYGFRQASLSCWSSWQAVRRNRRTSASPHQYRHAPAESNIHSRTDGYTRLPRKLPARLPQRSGPLQRCRGHSKRNFSIHLIRRTPTFLDTCQYLRDKWSSDNSAPGTVLMPIMFHSIGGETGGDRISEPDFHALMQALHESWLSGSHHGPGRQLPGKQCQHPAALGHADRG